MRDGPGAGRPLGAGLLDRVAVGAAILVVAAVVLAVPAVLAGVWVPGVGLAVVLVALVLAVLVVRRLSPGPLLPAGPLRPAGPLLPSSWSGEVLHRRTVLLLLALAAGGGAWAGLTHSEHVVLRRDAGTYAQYGHHLATEHTAWVDARVADLGGPATVDRPDVTVGSPGFYAQGDGADTHVVPQFLIGAPVWLSIGWWLGGWVGLLLVPAVVLGAAIAAFAALAVRLVGPSWAVPATAALTVCYPVLNAGRSTYSEPFALLLGCVGAASLFDAVQARWSPSTGPEAPERPERPERLALLAGLVLGGTTLFRVDALRECALLLPVAALLGARGAGRTAGRLLLGLGLAVAASAAVAAATTRPYLAAISGSLLPLLAGAVLLALGSVVFVLTHRRFGRPGFVRSGLVRPGFVRPGFVRPGGRARPGADGWSLPAVLAGAVAVIGVGFAARLGWQVVRQSATDPGARVVAGLQQRQGLPVDGGRTYAEHAPHWVTWWLGAPVLGLALVGAALLAWRFGRAWRAGGPLPAWFAPAVVAVGSTVLTLYRPGITPDHPWADRRLVPVVLPAVLLLAVAGLGATAFGLLRLVVPGRGRLDRFAPGRRGDRAAPDGTPVWLGGALAVAGTVLLVTPALAATWPLAGQRTERGEVAAVGRACAALGPSQTAILVDGRAANEWTQVLRGSCGVPTVVVRQVAGRPADPETVRAVSAAVSRAGRRPVLVAADSAESLRPLGGPARLVVDLRTTEDQRLLSRRPDGAEPLVVRLWVAPAD